MFETFTAHARRAIEQAQSEARGLGHQTVEIEHLLLGLLGGQDEIMREVRADFGLAVQPAREIVRQRLGAHPDTPSGRRLVFSEATKDALKSAYRFGLGMPGCAHILIVLTRRGEGAASEVLTALGVDPNQVRAHTKKRAFPHEPPGPSVRVVTHPGVPEDLDLAAL